MAVASADYKFVMVDVGAFGFQSGGGIFKNTHFFWKLDKGELNIPTTTTLPVDPKGNRLHYYFVGDEAFPLRVNIMRPCVRVRAPTWQPRRFSLTFYVFL